MELLNTQLQTTHTVNPLLLTMVMVMLYTTRYKYGLHLILPRKQEERDPLLANSLS